MTLDQFRQQIERLRQSYGEKYYPDERQRIIFEKVQKYPSAWFESTVSKLIGSRIKPPLLLEFIEEVDFYEKQQKEQIQINSGHTSSFIGVLKKAQQNAPEVKKSFVKDCLDLLEKRLKGRMTSSDFLMGCQLMDQAAFSPGSCKECDSSGWVFQQEGGYRVMYKCYCAVGKQIPSKQIIKRSNGDEIEIKFPEYRRKMENFF